MKSIKYIALLGVLIIGANGIYKKSNGFDMTQSSLTLNKDSIDQAKEKKEVLAAYNNKSRNLDESNLAVGKPYKIYYVLSGYEYVFEKSGSFKSVINEDYEWEAPLYDYSNNIVNTSIVWNDGVKWSVGKTGLDIPTDLVKFNSNDDEILSFLSKNGINNPKEIKRLKLASEHMDALFIVDEEDKEYLVPMAFENISNLLGIENLKLYDAKELILKIKEARS